MVTSRPGWWTVVGVAGDARYRRLSEATPTIYVHYRQFQVLPAVWTVAVRADGDPEAILPALRRSVDALDGEIDVWRVGTLDRHLARGPLAQPRMSASLLTGFGAAALLLAALGLYGVMALAVRERRRDLGVRAALGASARRLRGQVLGDAVRVTAIGMGSGLALTFVTSRASIPLMFEVEPWDPATVLAVGATLLATACAAAWVPAARATRTDPAEALRAD